jgi:peptidoglycan/LPS O-acetylase OafA/YrhL
MGLLRLVLAVAVFLRHSTYVFSLPVFGWEFVDSRIAVQAFFVISGFYMFLILNNKYVGKHAYRIFIENRFFKLYPAYWIVLLMTVLFGISRHPFGADPFPEFKQYFISQGILRPWSVLLLSFTNIFIVGQDLVFFLGINPSNCALFFTSNFRLTDPPLWKFMFIPPVWAVSLELMFYILVPFVARKRMGVILAIVCLSLTLRIFLYHHGCNDDPWTFRFFPNELAFFFSGGLAYHVYERLRRLALPRAPLYILLAVMIAITVKSDQLFTTGERWYFCSLIAVSTPFLFMLTKNSRWDRICGDLSYFIYIAHWLILNIARRAADRCPGIAGYAGPLALIVIILTALFLREMLKPVEAWRQRRLEKITPA